MNHKRKYSRSKSKSQEHEGIEEPLLRKLQRIEKSSDSGDDDDISANLLADADKILESLVKVAERDMKDVERAIYPKREELLAAMTQEVDQHVHKIKQHRQETLPSLEAAISGIKDIRDKLHSILEALDRDILALRSFSDQALLEEFEKIRSKETETLRKEVAISFSLILILECYSVVMIATGYRGRNIKQHLREYIP